VTAISRNVFLWSRRELRIPEPLQRALQVAPLAGDRRHHRARDLPLPWPS
jgi:hypothetical protein